MKQLTTWFWGLVSALFLAFNIYAEHSGHFLIEPQHKLALAACFCLLLTLAIRPMSSPLRRKIWLWLLFLYYLWVLANMLFFDAAFGRDSAASGINLVPMRTIHNYLRAYALGNIHLKFVVINLMGNLAAFAPMAIFLPALFPIQRNILAFFATILLMVGAVEMVQYITHTGSCDIDDLLLNTAGALAMWLLLLPWRLYRQYKEKKIRSA